MPGTEGAAGPFFSPDGQRVGFWADGELKKAPISGGPPVALCRIGMFPPYGTSWGPNDTVVFAKFRGGLWRVSAEGG